MACSALITGCSDGGLGSASALALHEKGYRVFATTRNVSKLRELEATGLETFPMDITSETSIRDCVTAVRKISETLDLLVNNAGIV